MREKPMQILIGYLLLSNSGLTLYIEGLYRR